MSLHLCVECAVVWLVEPDQPRICPRCGQPLTMMRDEKFSERPSWMLIASRAIHGEAPRVRRRWSIE